MTYVGGGMKCGGMNEVWWRGINCVGGGMKCINCVGGGMKCINCVGGGALVMNRCTGDGMIMKGWQRVIVKRLKLR